MTTPDPDGLLAEQLLRLTRRVHRIQKRHLEQRGLGITPAQSRLLRTLAHYSSPPAWRTSPSVSRWCRGP
ncbi:hypothetical protein SAV31267_081140 [Streptomyces avermitilis]|uniref:HTH marR-type domain-containing protein n=1 Tax=Streptomyces avermitilis TaxID=33903 RepID=A0A4D4N572_STRAX|nr:hypothetical protein SAV31267_081140 [Streptomyces avermitilis]